MSEIAPSSEEYNPQPATPEFIDLLNESVWPEFCREVSETEAAVVIYDPLDDSNVEITSQYALDLSEKLGWDYNGACSKVLGLAYPLDSQSGDTQEPIVLDTDSATFHGIDLCYQDGRWQAMLEFYQHEHTDDVPNGIYHIPPNKHHLMELKMKKIDEDDDADEDVNVIELFDQDIESTRAHVYSKDFTVNPPDQQRMLLNEITEGINSEVPHEFRDRDVVVSCRQYYTAYDDMPDFDLHDFLTDLTDTPSEEITALTGTIVNFEYPELRTLPSEQTLQPKDLTLNDGAYCLVLRDTEKPVTYYVLPQSVFGIV
jgi:hypothetical protein